MIDRIVGTAIFMIAVSAVYVARGYEAGFGDPLGPAMFPQMIGGGAALLSLGMILRPDPDPLMQPRHAVLRQVATVAVLVLYVLALEPLGFPLATTLGTAALALLFGASAGRAAVTGVSVGVSLFVLFDSVLGLPLPFAPTFFG